MDHLLWYPELTAAFTNDCCNRNAPAKISGGMWVIEPSENRMKQIEKMVYQKSPMVEAGLEPNTWHFGDMSMMLALFTHAKRTPTLFPGSLDRRQRAFNGYEKTRKDAMSYNSSLRIAGLHDATVQPLVPQIFNESSEYPIPKENNWGDEVGASLGLPQKRVWRMLNASFDFLPGECLSNCIPNRDRGQDFFFSLHFSCIPPKYSKPGQYESLGKFNEALSKFESCLRGYYNLWLDAYQRISGGNDRWSQK